MAVFELDNELFPRDPLTKTWQRQTQAIGGEGESIYADLWRLTLNFGTLLVTGQSTFFMGKFKADTLHDAKLPHPTTAVLTNFTGIAIESYSFTFTNIDRATWAFNPVLVLSGIKVNPQAALVPPTPGDGGDGLDVIEANFNGVWLESYFTYGGPDEAVSLDEVKFFDR